MQKLRTIAIAVLILIAVPVLAAALLYGLFVAFVLGWLYFGMPGLYGALALDILLLSGMIIWCWRR